MVDFHKVSISKYRQIFNRIVVLQMCKPTEQNWKLTQSFWELLYLEIQIIDFHFVLFYSGTNYASFTFLRNLESVTCNQSLYKDGKVVLLDEIIYNFALGLIIGMAIYFNQAAKSFGIDQLNAINVSRDNGNTIILILQNNL